MKITISKKGTLSEMFGEHLQVVNSLLDIAVKTFGVDIEIEEDAPEQSKTYTVDLAKFNITPGKMHKDGDGHYTDAQYQIAYNNGLGVRNAIIYASENGYDVCLLPTNLYTFTYLKDKITQNDFEKGVIYTASNQVLDLGGSTFEVMFDSTRKSPYHTAIEEPWKLTGWLFSTQNTTNLKIINGTLKGDVFQRSFIDPGENWIEQTTGISIFSNSYNITFENLDISGFMGDAFRGSTRGFSSTYSYSIAPKVVNMVKGHYESDGKLKTVAGSFYTHEILKIDRAQLAAKCPLYPNQLQLQTGGGYTRIPKFGGQQFIEVVFFDSKDKFIDKKVIQYLDLFELPDNAYGIRLQLSGVNADTFMHPHIAFTQAASRDIVIRNCKIHDNHRGGISNCADNTIIEYNDIYNNGMDCGIGAPLFPSSTRYAINCEDSVSNSVIIRNNKIRQGGAGIGVGCYRMEIYDNEFESIGGIAIYNNLTTRVANNIFKNSGQVTIRKGIISSDIHYHNNTVVNDPNTVFSITAVDGTSKSLFTNNNISAKNIQIQGFEDTKILFNDNVLYSDLNGIRVQNQNIYVDEFFRNTVTLLGEDNYLKLSLSHKSGGFNKFLNVDFISKNSTTLIFSNEEFTECHINPAILKNQTDEHIVEINNSTFNDCLISPFNGFIKNPTRIEKSKLILNNCEINIRNKETFVVASYPSTIHYEVLLIDCKLNYLEEKQPLLVSTHSQVKEIKIIKK